jgi:AcrR family transcriptional regulator
LYPFLMDKQRLNASTRRDRRVSIRRNQILDSAIQLFCEKGYHRTTTKDIAQAADISEGTIYNYFDSKEDLLIGIMARFAVPDLLNETLDGAPVGSKKFFLALVERHLSAIQENYPILRAVLSEILVTPSMAERYYRVIIMPVLNQLEEHLQRGVKEGQIRTTDVTITARLLVATAFGLFFLEAMGDAEASELDKFGKVLVDIFFEGVHPGGGIG